MGVTTIEGVIENGQIRLPAAVHLPERTKVYVIIPDVEEQTVAYIGNKPQISPRKCLGNRQMTSYDGHFFNPRAPVARVTLRDSTNGKTVSQVLMLLDSGADVSLIPQQSVTL